MTRVALLGRDDAVRGQLRTALADAGADLAYEGDLRSVDVAALRAAQPEKLIVNLEPGAEDVLDRLDSLLGDPGIEVVFNESEASSNLSGWDLARWARHLAAKVIGHGDTMPPVPTDAQRLPNRDFIPKPGAPRTPVQEVGEVGLERFAQEASSHGANLPESISLHSLDESEPLVAGVAQPAGADPAMADNVAASSQSAAELVLERSGTSNSDEVAGFELNLDELESALLSFGSDVAAPPPRRLGPDEPTVQLSRDDLHTEAQAQPSSGMGTGDFNPPRRLGPDEPTVVLSRADLQSALAIDAGADEHAGLSLDLSEIEASLSALDSATAAPRVDDSAPIDTGLGINFDFDLGATPSPGLDAGDSHPGDAGLSLADFRLDDHGDDAASLEADADVAALEAQLNALGSASPARAHENFDFDLESDLAGFDGSSQVSSGDALSVDELAALDSFDLPAEPSNAPVATPASKSSLFGDLSLAAEDYAAPAPAPAPATADAAKKRSFDFDNLSLSLEPIAEDGVPAGNVSSLGDLELEVALDDHADAAVVSGIPRIIVLGASIGGPDAVRTFLGGIPAGFPALFMLAQHLENGFFARLAQQLQKASKLQVRTADDGGGPAAAGQVVVVPSSARYSVTRDGQITANEHASPPHYKPCIDDLFRAAADEFGPRTTAIIFSGMAGDAVEGARYISSKGGEVWVQDPESCVVSSMVDGARSRGNVEFMGTPRELAEHCVARYG